jgi:pentatricopeptide repeat protein
LALGTGLGSTTETQNGASKTTCEINDENRMCRVGQKPNVVTYSSLIDYLCKNGRSAEARHIFDSMVEKGEKPNVTTYGSLLYGYAIQGNFIEMTRLIDLMVQNEIPPNHHVFNILMNACGKHGMVDEEILTFNKM